MERHLTTAAASHTPVSRWRDIVRRSAAVAAILICGWRGAALDGQDDPRLAKQLSVESSAFPQFRTGRDLKKEAASATGDVSARIVVKEHVIAPPPGMVVDPYDNGEIQALAAESDVIAICQVNNVTSALTADGGFVFSRYDLSIKTSLLDKVPGRTENGPVYLVAPGGEIVVSGHKIDASVSNVPRLIVGDSYLLYLKYDASVSSFRLAALDILQVGPQPGVLKASQSSVRPPNASLLGDEPKYLDALRANIATQLNRGRQ